MKTCSKCKKEKDEGEFSPRKTAESGLSSWCRICVNKQMKEYIKTKKGLVAKIYGGQRHNSKKRNHPMPIYTLQELRDWLLSQELFHNLYDNWVASGYKKELIPSCDRKNDYKSYTFDNIQLMTWGENKQKGHLDSKNGINNKKSRAVIQMDLDGSKITDFHSLNEAERQTGVDRGNISNCCVGRCKTVGGFIWKFK